MKSRVAAAQGDSGRSKVQAQAAWPGRTPPGLPGLGPHCTQCHRGEERWPVWGQGHRERGRTERSLWKGASPASSCLNCFQNPSPLLLQADTVTCDS